MTAIEWLHKKLAQSSQEELVGNINLWFKQAKEMEKQQKEVDYQSGFLDCYTKIMNERLTRDV